MILSDKSIREAVELGGIKIDPFTADQLNPASYDLTLGDEVLTYDFDCLHIHDVKQEPKEFRRTTIGPEGFVVHPGRGYLMHTRERVGTEAYVPVLDGKSSMGRLFVSVHQTAGFGDPGFDGQYTLEVTAHAFSVRLYAGMRIAQVRFHMIGGTVEKPYRGSYRGAASTGPVPSAIHRSFR